MQLNLALDSSNRRQAEQLRNKMYPNATVKQIRDAFIFDRCIEIFCEEPQVLLAYFDRDEKSEKVQRMVTIREATNKRLRTISAALEKPLAATFRAIIAYSVDHLNDDFTSDVNVKPLNTADALQQASEVLFLLETQLDAAKKTINDLKSLLAEGR